MIIVATNNIQIGLFPLSCNLGVSVILKMLRTCTWPQSLSQVYVHNKHKHHCRDLINSSGVIITSKFLLMF
jgi:hypothetical protein